MKSMYVQGYLLSSTVDFLAVDSWSLSYIWLLMVVGWFLPNLLILSSHVIVILTYRSAQTSTNHHDPPCTLSWLFRPHSRCSIKEFALQMGDMTRTNFLKQRLMVKMKFSLRLNILTPACSQRRSCGGRLWWCCWHGLLPGLPTPWCSWPPSQDTGTSSHTTGTCGRVTCRLGRQFLPRFFCLSSFHVPQTI